MKDSCQRYLTASIIIQKSMHLDNREKIQKTKLEKKN